MTILPTLIWNLLVPAVLPSLTIFLARRLGRIEPSGSRGRWGVAVGLGLGYLVGSAGLLGWPGWPPVGGLNGVFWLVVASVVLGSIEASWTLPGWVAWSARGLFAALLVGSLGVLDPGKQASVFEVIGRLLGLWMILMISWWNLEAQATRLSGPGWVVPLILISTGWAIVQAMNNDLAASRMEAVLASAFLGSLTTLGLRPGLTLSKGGPAVVLTVIAGLALTGNSPTRLPNTVASILCLAPWAPWIDRIGLIRRRSYWTRASVRFFAVLMTVGFALYLTDAWSERSQEERAEP